MSISEKANDLLNKFGRAQFDFIVWNTPDNAVARDKARQEISDYIAELEKALNIDTDLTIAGLRKELRDAAARIAELEAENDRLQDAWFKDETICPDGSLKPKVSTLLSRIAELTECIGSQMADVYTLKAHIAELEAAQRWIPVSERLPEDRATVLVAFTEYPERIDILTATYYKRYEGFGGVDNWWDIEGWYSGNVTHWMPLPELPEVQE